MRTAICDREDQGVADFTRPWIQYSLYLLVTANSLSVSGYSLTAPSYVANHIRLCNCNHFACISCPFIIRQQMATAALPAAIQRGTITMKYQCFRKLPVSYHIIQRFPSALSPSHSTVPCIYSTKLSQSDSTPWPRDVANSSMVPNVIGLSSRNKPID